jgi:hypothetical protein
MLNQPPQWPNQLAQSGPPNKPSGGSPPARSTLIFAVVAVVSSVLVVALFGTLLLVLSSHARSSAPGGQAQNGATATATAGAGQPTATIAATGTSTPGSMGGGGGGGTHHTPTPTPTLGTHAPPSVHQVVNQITLSGTNSGPVVATCPAGELALSGSWAVPYASGATIQRSARSGTRGWAISVAHTSDMLATSYADCLKDAPGATITERSASYSAPANTIKYAQIVCHTGEVVVGGGFATQIGVEITASAGNSAPLTGWAVFGLNHGTSPASFSAYVECLTYAKARSSQNATVSSTIAAGSTGSATSSPCPSGANMTGGYDYQSAGQAFVYAMSAQRVLGDDGSSYIVWKAVLYANGGQSVDLRSWAVCLGFS